MLLKNNFSQQEQSFTALVSGPWYYACLPTDSGIHLFSCPSFLFMRHLFFVCMCVSMCYRSILANKKAVKHYLNTTYGPIVFLVFF